MKELGGELGISLCGLFTSIATILVLVIVELQWDFAAYSLMHLFIIPTGAIIAGGLAASGYYFGALWLNTKPTPKILFNMVVISVGAYFSINYLLYLLMEVEGVPVSSIIDFPGFMDVMLTSMSYEMTQGGAETGELGGLGYGVAILQIIGFAIGGFAVYVYLKGKPYCDQCSKFYKKVWKRERYSGDADGYIEQLKSMFEMKEIKAISDLHQLIGEPKCSKETHLKAELKLSECPACMRQLLEFGTYKQSGNDWDLVSDLSFVQAFEPEIGEKTAGTAV